MSPFSGTSVVSNASLLLHGLHPLPLLMAAQVHYPSNNVVLSPGLFLAGMVLSLSPRLSQWVLLSPAQVPYPPLLQVYLICCLLSCKPANDQRTHNSASDTKFRARYWSVIFLFLLSTFPASGRREKNKHYLYSRSLNHSPKIFFFALGQRPTEPWGSNSPYLLLHIVYLWPKFQEGEKNQHEGISFCKSEWRGL